MAIVFNSLNVSGVITLRTVDANEAVNPIDLTDMTLEARVFDAGRVGRYGSDDYGSTGSGDTPLVTMAEGAGLEIDDAENGVVHLEFSPANSDLIRSNSVVCGNGRRRLQVEIWRTDSGAESRLYKVTDWAEA